jgi:hypothetical protein
MGVEALIDQLETRIRDARKVPLIGGVRIDRWEIYDLLDELRAELAKLVRPLDENRVVRRGAGVWEPIEELSAVVHGGGSADRVRVDRDRLLALVGRMREGVRQEEIVPRPAPEAYDTAPLAALTDQLEALVAGAAPVPLTPEVRVQKDEIYDILDRMRAALAPAVQTAGEPARTRLAGVLPAIDDLDDTVHNAKPIPLTDQVRLNQDKLSRSLKRIRAAFSQGTLLALTN